MRCYRHCRDAEPKTGWASSDIWNNLLLVFGSCFCDDVSLVFHALGGGLVLVHPRIGVFHGGDFESHGSSTALAQLGATSYHGYGFLLHFALDCVLCGQWQESTNLERTATDHILAAAEHNWNSTHRSCAVAPSFSSTIESIDPRYELKGY